MSLLTSINDLVRHGANAKQSTKRASQTIKRNNIFLLEISQHTGTSSVGHNAGPLLQLLLLLATSVSVTTVVFLKPQSFQIPSHLRALNQQLLLPSAPSPAASSTVKAPSLRVTFPGMSPRTTLAKLDSQLLPPSLSLLLAF